jgi:outer membrane protein TolC
MISVFIYIFFVPSSYSAIRIEPEDLTPRILQGNGSVAAQKSFVEASDVRTGYLWKSYLPKLVATGGHESFQTGHFSRLSQPYGNLLAELNVFRGGRDYLENQIRSLDFESAKSKEAHIFRGTLKRARELYWQIVSNRELISALTEILKQNELTANSANRRVLRGLTTPTDRLEFEIYRGQIEEEIESLRHANLLLQYELNPVVGLTKETELEVLEKIPHVHDESLMALPFDRENHVDMKLIYNKSEVANLEKRKGYLWWTPTVDLYAGYGLYTVRNKEYPSFKDRFETVVGVRITLEIFDGFKGLSDASERRYLSEGFVLDYGQKSNELDAEWKIAQEDLKHEHELIHFSEIRIKQGDEYLKKTFEEYDRGVKNSLDALSALQKYFSYMKENIERRKNYQLVRARLLEIKGE